MRCCGSVQQIVVDTPTGEVVLVRCAGCGDQRWCADGRELARDEAFSFLAGAYQAIPARAAASRERAAAATADRAVRRARAASGEPGSGHDAAPAPLLPAPRGARPSVVPDIVPTETGTETDTHDEAARNERLVSLLEGWQVLGAPVRNSA